jgi:hypothetical protein
MLVNCWRYQRRLRVKHTRDGQFALTLQESSIGDDELLRLNTEKDPISNYSVVRSLATPSRLLLDPSKNLFFISFIFLRFHTRSTALYMSSVLRLRQQGISQLKPLRLCGADNNIAVSEASMICFYFSLRGKLRDRRGDRSVGGKIL